jgi:hypothetical protein
MPQSAASEHCAPATPASVACQWHHDGQCAGGTSVPVCHSVTGTALAVPLPLLAVWLAGRPANGSGSVALPLPPPVAVCTDSALAVAWPAGARPPPGWPAFDSSCCHAGSLMST